MLRYLEQINDQPNNPIDYNINLQYHSIKTSTRRTTLIDFV